MRPLLAWHRDSALAPHTPVLVEAVRETSVTAEAMAASRAPTPVRSATVIAVSGFSTGCFRRVPAAVSASSSTARQMFGRAGFELLRKRVLLA
jgi:hypothetical protein